MLSETLRRDTTGAIDKALDEQNLERRIALNHATYDDFAICDRIQ